MGFDKDGAANRTSVILPLKNSAFDYAHRIEDDAFFEKRQASFTCARTRVTLSPGSRDLQLAPAS